MAAVAKLTRSLNLSLIPCIRATCATWSRGYILTLAATVLVALGMPATPLSAQNGGNGGANGGNGGGVGSCGAGGANGGGGNCCNCDGVWCTEVGETYISGEYCNENIFPWTDGYTSCVTEIDGPGELNPICLQVVYDADCSTSGEVCGEQSLASFGITGRALERTALLEDRAGLLATLWAAIEGFRGEAHESASATCTRHLTVTRNFSAVQRRLMTSALRTLSL